ncbi:cation:proton antiporter [Microbacterium xanthum]|uniref:cation:proton antiporter n=1 Tax=Microbacterium xanthum TaxID=3079794 RepID=UPI002AD2839B|nr:cation:proton antiporter [Microbacterium sp. KSW-48]MDZ8171452.1 cation:proton antiporter [Microbacterium sp. KSW-48]
MIAALVVLLALAVWSALSGPLQKRGVTAALFLATVGVAAGLALPDVFDLDIDPAGAERVAEVALVLLLFSDAMRIDLRALRRQLEWPSRLLLIGLPLTVLAGLGVGLLVFPGVAVISIALIAVMLAPTDAALGQRVVDDSSVPPRVRQALDVESGLNDGIAVPLFLVALSVANAELESSIPSAVAVNVAEQIGWGALAGLVAGVGGGALFRAASTKGWIDGRWRQALPLLAALLALAIAETLGGSGFIAAFVGGLAFGRTVGSPRTEVGVFTESAGDLLAAATWVLFGAVAVTLALPLLTWQVLLYAVASLTVVRMVPVAIALAGRRVGLPTMAFIGWFGPRGLASLVFLLIATGEGIPDADIVTPTVITTIALSIALHALTSVPFIGRFHRWAQQRASADPLAAEAIATDVPRRRHDHPAWLAYLNAGAPGHRE